MIEMAAVLLGCPCPQVRAARAADRGEKGCAGVGWPGGTCCVLNSVGKTAGQLLGP